MTKLILIHGAPGVGKSVLSTEIYSTLSRQGESVHYVQEYIKDLANRQFKLEPLDQIGVFGNQTFLLNGAIQGGYKYITSCSSPMLCSFYANHYSNNSFPSLVSLTYNWINYIETKYEVKTYNYFINLTGNEYEERFKQNGRYENLDDARELQDRMLDYFQKYYPEFIILTMKDINPQRVLKNIGINL